MAAWALHIVAGCAAFALHGSKLGVRLGSYYMVKVTPTPVVNLACRLVSLASPLANITYRLVNIARRLVNIGTRVTMATCAVLYSCGAWLASSCRLPGWLSWRAVTETDTNTETEATASEPMVMDAETHTNVETSSVPETNTAAGGSAGEMGVGRVGGWAESCWPSLFLSQPAAKLHSLLLLCHWQLASIHLVGKHVYVTLECRLGSYGGAVTHAQLTFHLPCPLLSLPPTLRYHHQPPQDHDQQPRHNCHHGRPRE
jgi:hypothetical protein